MTIIVTFIDNGAMFRHENIARIVETADRFELIEVRGKRGPICSTSYHRSLYTWSKE